MPYPYRNLYEWLDEEEKLGNVLRVRESIKCGDYTDLVDIGLDQFNPIDDPRGEMKGVQPKTEIRALVRYLHSLPNNPIGIIENPIDNRPDIQVAVNIWPNYERVLRGMGLKDKMELVDKTGDLPNQRIRPEIVPKEKAPCKQVIIPEDKIDLTKDIPRIWVEFNKICYTGCNGTIVTYDPETGTHGLSKSRLSVFDWDNGDPDQPFSEEKVKKYVFAGLARPGRPGQGNTGRYYFDKYRTILF